jgi:CMP-N,N'-diacetyllegionaminic acid synthase
MKIVAMIPARCGSKGVPDKNIKKLLGEPLLSYPIKIAKNTPLISKVYLNSDSEEYLKIGSTYGAEPFERSKEFSTDKTSMKSVLENFLKTLADRKEYYDAIMPLYPVFPNRTSENLAQIIYTFKSLGGNRPIIGLKTPKTHPYLCYHRDSKGQIENIMKIDANKYFRRQQYPEYYQISHWALMLPTPSIKKLNAQLVCSESFGYKIESHNYIDIDTLLDFKIAEVVLQNHSI